MPLLLPVLLWQVERPELGQFELLAADIGQGNAVLVRTAGHALVYDAGPRFSSENDAGQRVLVPLLRALPGVQVASPAGGMYAFFKLDGFDDSLTTAKRLVLEAGLGLAPGNAFAPQAQGWLRWCFASHDPQRLVQGVARLQGWLEQRAPG